MSLCEIMQVLKHVCVSVYMDASLCLHMLEHTLRNQFDNNVILTEKKSHSHLIHP